MDYCFHEPVERRNTQSIKWDYTKEVFGVEDLLPLWVADMDFEAPPAVLKAMEERLQHGVFGYTGRRPSLWDAVAGWQRRRHGWDVDINWFSFSPGVVKSIHTALTTFTHPGDKVIIQTPVYPPFFHVAQKNGRQLLKNPLQREGQQYRMDLEHLQKNIDQRTRMLILCSPHNPVGRVWQEEELKGLAEICLEHNILMVVDEIWSDFIYPGHRHRPLAALDEEIARNTITCISPSKTFNLAGLASSAVIIPHPVLRQEFQKMQENTGAMKGNIFGAVAMEAAYKEGDVWVDQLIQYLQGNLQYLINFLEAEIPAIQPILPEGTYVVWLDCSALGLSHEELKGMILQKARVGLNCGKDYGVDGDCFMRINIACHRSTLEEALQRLKEIFQR